MKGGEVGARGVGCILILAVLHGAATFTRRFMHDRIVLVFRSHEAVPTESDYECSTANTSITGSTTLDYCVFDQRASSAATLLERTF
jgi:hypothetical protein